MRQLRAGKKVRGRNCEALPKGGVMAMGQATTEALRRKGNYRSVADAKRSWNGYSRTQKTRLAKLDKIKKGRSRAGS